MRLHWWPKIQASGTGLTLVSTIAPSLGIPIQYSILVALFCLGAVMIFWPVAQAVWEWKKSVAVWVSSALVGVGFVSGLSLIAALGIGGILPFFTETSTVWIVAAVTMAAMAAVAHFLTATIERRAPAGQSFSFPDDWDKPLEKLFRVQFRNQTVFLDGHEFIECNFENVTFKFNGTKPFRFTGSNTGNSRKVTTDNKIVGQTLTLSLFLRPDLGLDYEISKTDRIEKELP